MPMRPSYGLDRSIRPTKPNDMHKKLHIATKHSSRIPDNTAWTCGRRVSSGLRPAAALATCGAMLPGPRRFLGGWHHDGHSPRGHATTTPRGRFLAALGAKTDGWHRFSTGRRPSPTEGVHPQPRKPPQCRRPNRPHGSNWRADGAWVPSVPIAPVDHAYRTIDVHPPAKSDPKGATSENGKLEAGGRGADRPPERRADRGAARLGSPDPRGIPSLAPQSESGYRPTGPTSVQSPAGAAVGGGSSSMRGRH
jgi:hypothetical protein